MNNPLVKWLGVISRGAYQASAEDIRWAYEQVSHLWPDVELGSYSGEDESIDEGVKGHKSFDYQS